MYWNQRGKIFNQSLCTHIYGTFTYIGACMVDKITRKQNKSSHVCTMQCSFLNPNLAMPIGSDLFHLESLNELTKCWLSHSVIMLYNFLMLMIVVDMFQSNFIYSPAKKVIRTVISKVSSHQALCVWVRWFDCVVYTLKRRTQLLIINWKGNIKIMIWLIDKGVG